MQFMLNIVGILVLLSSFYCTNRAQNTFDIRNFGAVSSDKTTIDNALSSAWKQACATGGAATIFIPHATYYLGKIDLAGPCKGSMTVHIKGTLVAPASLSVFHGDSWIRFIHLNHLTIVGGTLDGQGKLAWQKNNCKMDANCKSLPMNLRLDFITNGLVQGLTSKDSKNFHINVLGCENLIMKNLKIRAPANSVNTDGIHIGRSTGIQIINAQIATGDDCISIGDGSRHVTITGVTCGPGHGLAIGSLGKYEKEAPVSGIHVHNCTLINTTNGLRIKTWPGMYQNIASDIIFKDIFMINVYYPMIIDQTYCPWNQCKAKTSSNVKIDHVKFINIRGTSATSTIAKLLCSHSIPCENVELSGIRVTYKGKDKPKSECVNVKPTISVRTESLNGC